jgi:hypothetical protein
MYVPVPRDADVLLLLDVNLFATDEILREAEIHAGDQLFALGYPFGAESNAEGFPILRSGAIASYPIVPTRRVKTFLFDFEIRRGNSGGPVYFYQQDRLIGGRYPSRNFAFIMGIVSNEKLITEEIRSMYQTTEEHHPINMAVVIHASLIKETLELLP